MDIRQVIDSSQRFYEEHKLKAWAEAIGDYTPLTPESQSQLDGASRLGLTQAMVFPPLGVQLGSLDTVIQECAMRPVEGIPPHAKLEKPYISDDQAREPSGRVYQTSEGLETRKTGLYLLCFDLETIPEETRGKKGNQIARLFRQQGWTGFTSPELLIATRAWRERKASEGVEESALGLDNVKWVWLVDSGDSQMCSAAFYGLQGIGMYGCKIGSANRNRGANVTLVVPL